MILDSQERYLASMPDRVVRVSHFDPRARELGWTIVEELRHGLPGIPVHFIGAASLGIAGQNDVDIEVLSLPSLYSLHGPVITRLYGPPARAGKSIKWAFTREGFEVELYLTDMDSPSVQRQLRFYELLAADPTLRAEYLRIKMPYGPTMYKAYMRRKYAFYNRVLGLIDPHD